MQLKAEHDAEVVANQENHGKTSMLLVKADEINRQLQARCERLEQNTRPLTFSDRGSDALALAVFDWIERGIIPTRSKVSDALESWAACRFDCLDGTEIQKLREFATAKGERSKATE